MEFCCPSPEHPVIALNSTTIKHRKKLRYLMYGEVGVCLAKSILYSPISGIMQLITLWMLYMGWATMHFCQVMVFMVGVGIDMFFLLLDYKRMSIILSGNGILMFLFWMMVVYDVIAFIISYKAY